MSDLANQVDKINVCHAKLRFLTDVFSQDQGYDFQFSEDGITGFYYLLADIADDLEHISDEMLPSEEV